MKQDKGQGRKLIEEKNELETVNIHQWINIDRL